MKQYIITCLCLIFLVIKPSVDDIKKIVYPIIANSATVGVVAGLLAPTPRGSLAILAILESPFYITIPFGLALINMIIAVKRQGHSVIDLQGYYPTIYSVNFNNLTDNIAIATVSFFITFFAYAAAFDIAKSLKQKLIRLYKKLNS